MLMRALLARLRHGVRQLLLGLLALVLLFEEWGWEPLAALFARLRRFAPWAWLEQRIAALGPRLALLAFALPMVLLLPAKLLALYLFGTGHYVGGLLFLLGAKLVSTALLARLFQLTQPALMRLRWFARWYPRWKQWKDALMARVRQSAPWRRLRGLRRRVRAGWARLRRGAR